MGTMAEPLPAVRHMLVQVAEEQEPLEVIMMEVVVALVESEV